MRDFPVECSECSTVYESRDELRKRDRGLYQYTYHCPECEIKFFRLTIKRGTVLDSKVF